MIEFNDHKTIIGCRVKGTCDFAKRRLIKRPSKEFKGFRIQCNKIFIKYDVRMRVILRNSYHMGIKALWYIFIPVIRLRIRSSRIAPIITCDRDDGGGAQLHGRISTIVFAEALGLKYVHTPLTDVHFMRTTDEVDRWNELIDFENFGPRISSDAKVIKFKSMVELLAKLFFGTTPGSKHILEVQHCHAFTDRFPKLVSGIRPRLRDAYRSASQKNGVTSPEDVVIHFRGLVGAEDEHSPRLSSALTIRKKIEMARVLRTKNKSLVVCVSPTPDLIREVDSNFILDYESDVHTVFRLIADAKVVFIARSSLSYVAALLNPRDIYYEDFWHPKMPDWHRLH